MTSHPDADAFMRGYLRTPTDVTTRLVFADWLEETGRPSNVAWAHFIRAKAAADAHPWGGAARRRHEAEAGKFAPHIRAYMRRSGAPDQTHATVFRLMPSRRPESAFGCTNNVSVAAPPGAEAVASPALKA